MLDSLWRRVRRLSHRPWTKRLHVELLEPRVLLDASGDRFLARAYEDLFHRQPDAGGLAFWGGLLEGGLTRTQVADELLKSPESQDRLTRGLYDGFLRRPADADGLAWWLGQFRLGLSIHQVRTGFLGSPEYFQTRGGSTHDGFLTALAQDVLGRALQPDELTARQQDLADGVPRAEVGRRLLTSPDGLRRQTEDFYQTYLHRTADGGGLGFWSARLAQTGRSEIVIQEILGSEEYFTRAQTPTDTQGPTLTVTVPTAGTTYSGTARLVGSVADAGSGVASVEVAVDGGAFAPLPRDAAGRFDRALSATSLTVGSHQAVLRAADVAGNVTEQTLTFEVGDAFRVGPTGSAGWGSATVDGVRLEERDSFLVQHAVTVPLGQAQGTRTLSFQVMPALDTATVGDRLLVSLLDPTDPTRTLLDGGRPGTPLFALSDDGRAEFLPGRVRFDGTTVQVDVTAAAATTGRLVIQFVSGDSDEESSVQVSGLTNVVDPEGVAPATFPGPTDDVLAPGAVLDLTALASAADIAAAVSAVRLNPDSGLYEAELTVRNDGSAALGRSVAVVFPGLPAGVTLLDASGTDAAGAPYVSLRDALPSGGLRPGATSPPFRLNVSDPDLIRFALRPTVLAAGPNRAPTLTPVGPLSVMPGDRVEVALLATDPDGDTVAFNIVGDLPTGRLSGNTLVFTPSPADIGTYTFTVMASDGAAESRRDVTMTVTADPIATTRISGVIQNTAQQPLADIPITIGDVQTVTAADGSFELAFDGPLPSDTLKVHAEQLTGSVVYPFIAEKLPLLLEHEVYAGVDNVVSRPIYLPPLDVASGRTVDPSQDTTVTTVNIPGAVVLVKAGSLKDQQGNPYTGVLSITEVPVELTPAALPADQATELVVTIQPGEMVFTQPAPLALPNRSGYGPGSLADLWSINPVTGVFDKVGVGRVSADGSVIETIEGGIRNSSWHYFSFFLGLLEPFFDDPFNESNICDECKCVIAPGSTVEMHSGTYLEMHDTVPYQSLGQSRGLTLTYDSTRVPTDPILHFGYTVPDDPNTPPTTSRTTPIFEMKAIVERGSFRAEGPTITWPFPLDLESFDGAFPTQLLRGLPTGRYDITLEARILVERIIDGQPVIVPIGNTTSEGGHVLHVNETDSPFGAGWGLSGLQRIVENADGSVLLLDGDGSELLFDRPAAAGQPYVSPPGDFTVLEKLADGTFRRTTTDQTVSRFDAQNRLASVRDRNNNETLFEYDGAGRPTGIIDPVGLRTILAYESGRLKTITDPASRTTEFQYDGEGNLTRVTDPDRTFRTFNYQPGTHRLRGEFDKLRREERVSYDAYGRVESVTRPDGSVVRVSPAVVQGLGDMGVLPHLPASPVAVMADGNGNTTTYVLDGAGQMVFAFDGEGGLGSVQRNAQNLVTMARDARSNPTTFTYDNRGNVTSVRDTLSGGLAPTAVPVGRGPTALAAVDLDNDGKNDLISANDGDRSLSLAAGQGDGSFAAATTVALDAAAADRPFVEPALVPLTFPTREGAVSLARGDFNGDGNLDLAVTGVRDVPFVSRNGTLSILLGRGDGTFADPVELDPLPAQDTINWRGTPVVLARDFDGDGKLDLVANTGANSNNEVRFYRGRGDGTFVPFVATPTPFRPSGLQAGDLDGDGDLDLVALSEESSQFGVLFNTGGAFAAPVVRVTSAPLHGPRDAALVDLDGRNGPDLIVQVGDFFGESIQGRLQTYLNDGTGTFADPPIVNSNTGFQFGFQHGDFDGDGRTDLFVLLANRTGVFLKGQGNGHFALLQAPPEDPARYNPWLGGYFAQRRYSDNVPAEDVNGDGRLDVVIPYSEGNLVLVGLGRGDGTFALTQWVASPGPGVPSVYNSLGVGQSAVTGDFNRDGVFDLVVAQYATRTVGQPGGVSLLTGTDPGEFASPRAFPIAQPWKQTTRSTALGDYDNDGDLDLAALIAASDQMHILPGNGDGTFAPSAVAIGDIFGLEMSHTLRPVDFDRDGNLDVIAAGVRPFGGVNSVVAFGNGDRTFEPPVFLPRVPLGGLGGIGNLVVADFNGDNFPDVAQFETADTFTTGTDLWLHVFLYDPLNPRTYREGQVISQGHGFGSSGLAAADFDRDGTADLLYRFATDPGVAASETRFFRGKGDGTFDGARVVAGPPGAVVVGDIQAADLNHDDKLDAIFLGGGSVFVALGDGNGNFSPTATVYQGTSPTDLGLADVNRDGHLDLVVGDGFSLFSQGLSVLYGNGDGTFAAPARVASSTDNALNVEVGDLNRDGLPDVIVAGGSNSLPFTVHLNALGRLSLAAGDVNGDGKTDLAVADGRTGRVQVLRGAGDRSFPTRTSVAVGDGPSAVLLVDVTGDGKLDLVTANSRDDSVSVARGDGAGGFAAAAAFAVGVEPGDVAAGRVDDDAFLDLVVANTGDRTVTVLYGDGAGGFGRPTVHTVGARPVAVALGDINGDGRADVFTANQGSASVTVLWSGPAGFPSSAALFVGDAPSDVAVGDVTGDGLPDVVAASANDGTLTVVRTDAFGSLIDHATLTLGGAPSAVVLARLDGDASPDIAVADRTGGRIAVTLTGSGLGNGSMQLTYEPVFTQLTSMTDELGRKTLLEIDPANGNRLSVTEAVGAVGGPDDRVTHFTYTTRGQLDTVTDALGRVTDYDYDALGRLTRMTLARGTDDEGVWTVEYDPATLAGRVGLPAAMRDPNGVRSEIEYDALNRPTAMRDALGRERRIRYDAAGNVKEVTDARGDTTVYDYDPRDRLERVTAPAVGGVPTVTELRYDAAGNLRFVIDPLLHVTETRYDKRNRPSERIDPDGGVTRMRYDLDNNVTRIVDGVNNVTIFGYDARGRTVREIDPLDKAMTYAYDAVDNLVQETDRNLRVTRFRYDELDRVTTETWFDPAGAVVNLLNYTYDLMDNLLSARDTVSAVAFGYDDRDRVDRADNVGTPGVPNVVLDHRYDAGSNLRSTTDTIAGQAGAQTTYIYDSINRLTRITQAGTGGLAVAEKRIDFGYNEIDLFESIARYADLAGTSPVANTSYTYDAQDRLTRIEHDNATGSVAFYDFGFDAFGRIETLTDVDGTTAYSYDDRDQLTGAQHSDPTQPDETYRYDANGNRLESSGHGTGYDTGPANRLRSDGTFAYEYDDEGNQVRRREIATGNLRELSYDHRNRLTAVTDKDPAGSQVQRVEFTYDAIDRRISKRVITAGGDVLTHFVYDGMDVILDFRDGDGPGDPGAAALTERYLHGPAVDQVLSGEDATGRVLWHLTDHLGTVRDLVDSTGAVANHIKYDAFGTVIVESDPEASTRYRFTGRESDVETGLVYYRARYYDSRTGRFLAEDAIGFAAADGNLYRYVGNVPVSLRDPSGLSADDCWKKLAQSTPLLGSGSPVEGLSWSAVKNRLSNKFPRQPLIYPDGPEKPPYQTIELDETRLRNKLTEIEKKVNNKVSELGSKAMEASRAGDSVRADRLGKAINRLTKFSANLRQLKALCIGELIGRLSPALARCLSTIPTDQISFLIALIGTGKILSGSIKQSAESGPDAYGRYLEGLGRPNGPPPEWQ